MGTQLGAVDLGSNSLRCLVVDYLDGKLMYKTSGLWITRISEGISSSNFTARRSAVERTVGAMKEALKLFEAFRVEKDGMKVFATESLRAAGNGDSIRKMLEELCEVPIEVLSPSKEAHLSRKGALLGLEECDVVFDLGGGSLEVCGENFAYSFPLGAVRMTNRFDEDCEKIKEETKKALAEAQIKSKSLAGVGGTSSNLAMMAKGIPNNEYHPSKIHGSKINVEYLTRTCRRLKALSLEERKSIVGLESGREDIIIAGICVIEALLGSLKHKEYTHSETDLLWAQCASIAEGYGMEVREILL